VKLLLRIVLGLAGLALVLAVALAIAVALLFDPQEYRPLLAASVEKATGRTLRLEGELGLAFFPCCSITVERAALGNPPGFPAGDFASVESAALSIKVWPLLTRREVQIGTVRLEGLDASLIVRADGAANWEFDSAEDAAPADAGTGTGSAAALLIEGLRISGGRIAYRDESDGSSYRAEDLKLDTGAIEPGKPFDLDLAATLTDASDGTSGDLTLQARALADAALSRVTLTAPRITLKAAGGAVPAGRLESTLGAGEIALDFARDPIVDFSQLQGEFALQALEALAGDASGRFSADTARLQLGASNELTLPALAAQLTVSGKDVPGGSVETSLQLKTLSLDIDKLRAGVESLGAEVSGLGGRMSLTGSGRLAGSGAAMKGTVKLEPLSPRGVLALLREPEPKTADPKVLTRLGGTARWSLGEDSLGLDAMDMQLDDTRLKGSLDISNFDQPVTRFDLSLDAIDLDRYLEPDAPEGDSRSGEGKSAPAADDIPVETIRDLRLDGRLRAAKLSFAGIAMSNVDATLRAAGGRLRLDPLRAGLYSGEYRGAIGIDATAPTARVTLEQQLDALQVGEALQALYQTDKLEGALTGRVSASASGNTTDALLRSLSGNVALSLANGAYLGTDLWHEIRAARARLKGEAPPPASAAPKTPLNALELAGRISDGVLRSERLLAEVPFIRVSGAGALDLVGKALDYRIEAQVLENPTFEDGTTLKDLKGLTIPVTLKGPMDQPKVSVELKELAAGVATQKLRERLLKKLGGDEPPPAGGAPADAQPADGTTQPGAEPAPAEQPPKEEKPRDALKRTLRDLLKPPQ